jgi:hypothetical protein
MSNQGKKNFRLVEPFKVTLRRLKTIFHRSPKDLDAREYLAARDAEAFLHNRRELGNVEASRGNLHKQ